MAAPAVARSSGPALCPSFAEVCSFLERYGAALDLPEMTFPQMERYLRDTTAGETSLVAEPRSVGKLRHLKPKRRGHGRRHQRVMSVCVRAPGLRFKPGPEPRFPGETARVVSSSRRSRYRGANPPRLTVFVAKFCGRSHSVWPDGLSAGAE